MYYDFLHCTTNYSVHGDNFTSERLSDIQSILGSVAKKHGFIAKAERPPSARGYSTYVQSAEYEYNELPQ
jgi:hypothetical protein